MEFFFYFHFFTESVCFFYRHYAKLKKYENSNEICIGHGPKESGNDYWMCICGVKKPTVQEAERFYAADVALYGGHVLGVYPIDLNTARACYDFERADRWPVFGL